MRPFFHATATLIGMIIGVGIFAVPYVSAQAGFAAGVFWILLLGGVSLLIHLYFGEIASATPGKHRLPGYAAYYLGRRAKQIITTTQTVAFWGAQLAYMIAGGTFLRILLRGGGQESNFFPYILGLFIFVALVAFLGVRIFKRIEFWMTAALLLIVGVILILGAPHVEVSNLSGFHTGAFFVPYGVVLFALGGAPAIPEMVDITRRRAGPLRWSIIAGTLISIIITLLFAFVVVGVSGAHTTQEGFQGLAGALGPRIVKLGALFGFFAVITSYLVVALYLKELFAYDFRLKHVLAWLFAVCVPFLFFLAGERNFVRVVDIVGGVFGGFDAIMILLVALAFFKRRHVAHRKVKTALGVVVIALLTIGVLQKLFRFL